MGAQPRQVSRKEAKKLFQQFIAEKLEHFDIAQAMVQLVLNEPFATDEIISSDRTVAVLGAAFLDNALEDAIRKHLSNTAPEKVKTWLFSPSNVGPLSTSGAKVKMACALGILSEEDAEDLDTIYVIRNGFAHVVKSIRPCGQTSPRCGCIRARRIR